ncbi:MAG: transposase [Candidatus Micrarchaeota archaeon]|nr:transposase [Candidatus Micrarchaeota archaeon]
MQRSILLQTAATTKKNSELSKALSVATSEFNRLWDERDFCSKFMDFHRKVYLSCKKRTSFNSQVVCDIERSVWRSKGKSKGITLKFNVPRNCKTFEKTRPFIKFSPFSKNPISVPVIKNRNFQRYSDLLESGWTCKTYGLTSRLEIVAYLSKEDIELPQRKNVLGIDFNAKRIAVSILSPQNRVLYQDYFGKHIWIKRKRIMERRSKMQSSNNLCALRRLRNAEFNFTETNIGQMVKAITDLALKYDADISIENLKRFRPKGKRFNKTVMRMPFFKFKEILVSRCFDKGITLNIVDSWHTSKFCNHCGAVGKGHDSRNYALFRCKECGVVMNSDRNASRNIALKCLLERKGHILNKYTPIQISNREGLCKRPCLPDEVGLPNVAVQHAYRPMESPRL